MQVPTRTVNESVVRQKPVFRASSGEYSLQSSLGLLLTNNLSETSLCETCLVSYKIRNALHINGAFFCTGFLHASSCQLPSPSPRPNLCMDVIEIRHVLSFLCWIPYIALCWFSRCRYVCNYYALLEPPRPCKWLEIMYHRSFWNSNIPDICFCLSALSSVPWLPALARYRISRILISLSPKHLFSRHWIQPFTTPWLLFTSQIRHCKLPVLTLVTLQGMACTSHVSTNCVVFKIYRLTAYGRGIMLVLTSTGWEIIATLWSHQYSII